MPYRCPQKRKECNRLSSIRYNDTAKGRKRRVKYRNSDKYKQNERKRSQRVYQARKGVDSRSLSNVLREAQNHRCAYCKTKVFPSRGQLDRIVPGVDYTEGNVFLSCSDCNQQKWCHTVDKFLDMLMEQGIIKTKQWTSPCGRYHRLRGGKFKPNPLYKGSLSQVLPEHK